jgi:hypothetical protein
MGCPTPTEGGDHIESYWQVAIHHHRLDHLGLDSGRLRGSSDSDCDKYKVAQLAILNLDYCSYHDKRGDHKSGDCLCPHIKCLPHWRKCYIPKTHLYYGGGCLIDDTIEGVCQKQKQKQIAVLDILVEVSLSRHKTDKLAGGTAG